MWAGTLEPRKGPWAGWRAFGILMLVLVVSFAFFVVRKVPLPLQPPTLAWALRFGFVILGIGFGLIAAPVLVAFWYPILVAQALDYLRARGGENEISVPHVVPDYGPGLQPSFWAKSLIASLAVLGGLGVGALIEFRLTREFLGSGVCLVFVGLVIGYFVIPWLWMAKRIERRFRPG